MSDADFAAEFQCVRADRSGFGGEDYCKEAPRPG